MTVTIAIATYNRAGEVEKTLATLTRLDTAGCSEHEVLVVDNNSTDGTAAVVGRMAPLFSGRLRYVREPRQGLSHARNRAIDEARFEVVAYLDDDVDVEPEWLRALCDAYASGDVAGVGGRAYLVFPGPRPRWLGESIDGLLTKVELGPVRRPAGVHELYGVNLSFRRDWLVRAGGFRTDIGRVGTTLFGGEDDDMIGRVVALGGVMLYEPGAAVGHRVPPGRLSQKWFWKRCYWGGVSAPRTWPDRQITGYELLRRTWHVVRTGWRAVWTGLRHGPRSAACFRQVLDVAIRAGTWAGLFRELLCRGRRPSRGRAEQLCPAG